MMHLSDRVKKKIPTLNSSVLYFVTRKPQLKYFVKKQKNWEMKDNSVYKVSKYQQTNLHFYWTTYWIDINQLESNPNFTTNIYSLLLFIQFQVLLIDISKPLVWKDSIDSSKNALVRVVHSNWRVICITASLLCLK